MTTRRKSAAFFRRTARGPGGRVLLGVALVALGVLIGMVIAPDGTDTTAPATTTDASATTDATDTTNATDAAGDEPATPGETTDATATAEPTETTEAITPPAPAGVPPGPEGGAECGLDAAAFCDTFDSPVFDDPSGPRNGPLAEVWGVSGTRSDVSVNHDNLNRWMPATIEGCGPTETVNAPSDVRVCNGRLYEASNDVGVQTLLAMYPKQPFNWAGRTGRVVFDASTDTMGSHGAWGEFWITDQPIPTPTGAFVGGQAPYIRNGVGFTMALDKCNSDPNLMSIDRISVIRNYVAEEHFFDNASAGCIHKVGPDAGALNHFEVRVSANRFEVYGTNPGSAALILLAGIDNPNLTLPKEQGLIWISDGHYNASEEKTGYPGGQHIHTFAWDNVGFDGPKTYRDLSFDVPDALVSSGDGVNLGYVVSEDDSRKLTTVPMYRAQEPTGALVTFNWYHLGGSVPSFRVNDGPWHDPEWPFTDDYGFCYRALGVSIPAEETRDGPNTIEFRMADGATAVTNVNLILIAGAPVP